MKHYCLSCGNELQEEQMLCPKCGHCSFLDALEKSAQGVSSILGAQQIEANTQWVKYKCGKDGLAGHGFAAEDANALEDLLWGYDVDFVGRTNEEGGADRKVNGQFIQTKYCKTARDSVNAAFASGKYAYNGQILEVPLDQYEEALRIMREKIIAGQVEGVTNPDDASKIIRKGSVTYEQAKNIAKAGNIDSLIFDAKIQSITAVSAFGISFAITTGMMLLFRSDKMRIDDIMQSAFLAGLYNGTISLTSNILTMQVLRTQFGRNLVSYIQWGTKSSIDSVYRTELGKKFVHKLSQTLFNKAIYGGAAKNATIKFFRTNAITNLATFVVTSMPDTYYLLQGKISPTQYIKNLVVNSSSIAGATLGAALGSMLGPAGMIGGGLAGGTVFSWASKKVADKISKDDSEKMCQLIKVALLQLSHDYMIQTDEEFQRCIDIISYERAIDTNFLRVMYSIGKDTNDDFLRVQVAYERLAYYFGAVIRQRKTVLLKDNQQRVLNAVNSLGDELSPDKFEE